MNCEQCQIELEDFLYGELSEKRTQELRGHLTNCAECRAVQASLEREAEIFSAYHEQNALEPGDEMWQAIRLRIHEEPLTSPSTNFFGKLKEWFSVGIFGSLLTPAMFRQVAFALLLITLSVGATIIYFKLKGEQNNPQQIAVGPTQTASPTASAQPTPTPTIETPKTEETTKSQIVRNNIRTTPTPKAIEKHAASESEIINAQVARAVREYQGAVKLLERAVDKRKQDLDQNAMAQYEKSLALIDESISASRRALREHPDDPSAARFLLAAYSRKVELMQEIAMR